MQPTVRQAVMVPAGGQWSPATVCAQLAEFERQGFDDLLILSASGFAGLDGCRLGRARIRVLPFTDLTQALPWLQHRFLLHSGLQAVDANFRAMAAGRDAMMVATDDGRPSGIVLLSRPQLAMTLTPPDQTQAGLDLLPIARALLDPAAAPLLSRRPAVFLDRDGVLNQDTGYVGRREQLEWLPDMVTAVRRINDAGYRAVVVTNQAGVGRGFFNEDDVRTVHGLMEDHLAAAGAYIDRFYYCPYHPDAVLPAYRAIHPERKPGAHMVLRAAAELDIDLSGSSLIGDRDSDMECAAAAGVRGILIQGDDILGAVATALCPDYAHTP